MSSSTGTRKPRDVQSRATESIIESDKELVNSFKIFAESSNSTAGLAGTAVNNSPKTPAGNYLAREGDSMIGPLALGPPLNFRIVIDTNNTIDIGRLNENAQYTSNVQLDSIQPNSFVLNIIANAAFDGQILILRTFAPTTPFTFNQATLGNGGNIQTGDDTDLTVGDLQTVTLVFDQSLGIAGGSTGLWRILSVSSGGGTGSQTPWIQTIEGAGFTLNNAGKIIIKPIQTDGLAGILELVRNDTTPLAGDTVGQILFKGPDDIGGFPTWGIIETDSDIVTNTAKQGQFKISVQHDNSLAGIIDYTGSDGTFRFSSGVDIVRPNSNGTKELGTSSFFWDDVFSETFTMRGTGGNTLGTARAIYADAAGMVFNMPTSAPVFTHSVNNKIFSLLSDSELEIRTEIDTGPTLRLRNNDQTPTNNETAATILFTGEDSALAQATWGSLNVEMDVVTAGAKQADMVFKAQQNNSLKTWMNFLGNSDKINMFANMDLGARFFDFDNLTTPVNPGAGTRRLFVDSGTGELSVRTSSGTTVSLEGGGTNLLPLSNTWTGATNTFDNNVVLGSSNADTVTFNADTSGNITPNSDSVDALGSSSRRWLNMFTDRLTFDNNSGHAVTPGNQTPEIFYNNDTNGMTFHGKSSASFAWIIGTQTLFQASNTGIFMTGGSAKFIHNNNGLHQLEISAGGSGVILNSATASSIIALQIDETTEYEFSSVAANFKNNNLTNITNIELGGGFDTSKLFFDSGGDTYLTGSGTSGRINVVNDGTNKFAFTPTEFFIADGVNISIGVTTGTKIGLGATTKIGFYGTTPVVQQTVGSDTLANLYTALRAVGIIG